MKVILSERVANLGDMGQTVKVADGYARNYLIPRKLAVDADSASAHQIEHEMRMIRKRMERARAKHEEEAKAMGNLTLEFKARAGEGDKLFGSVTTAQIAERLIEAGFDVDRKSIMLAEPIKSLGIFIVPVKLGQGVEASVKVWVVSDQPVEITVEDAEEDAEDSTESQE